MYYDIAKPQDTYGIHPDNSDQPFLHSESAVPPELKVDSAHESWIDSPDTIEAVNPVKPPPLHSTPYTYVDTVDGLLELRAKLDQVDEFAVDLEANMYRSYQGLTCLMQISTRTEDFVVDTLKLHHEIGRCLGGVFSDTRKRKVMHGAYKDVFWMQRDFGIYVCNLFDTMHASQVLKLERNALWYLLGRYCDVAADKEYKICWDWRVRPIPQEMVHYARQDTHYLLYIYDRMRKELAETSVDPLLEVYRTSHEICCAMYKKEVFDEDSYKKIYGFEKACLKTQQQLDVVARLYKWRDCIAREKDESTGYVMPNKLLLEISAKMPETKEELHKFIAVCNYPHHPLVWDNTDQIFNIIFESYLQQQQKIMAQVANERAIMLQQQKTRAQVVNAIRMSMQQRYLVPGVHIHVNYAGCPPHPMSIPINCNQYPQYISG